MGYEHEICYHKGLEFVTGDGTVYTNNIECFWSHFRRMITGCYHDVSDKHLQSYIDEACYRWNMRKNTEAEIFADMFCKSIGAVSTWKQIKIVKEAA